MAKILILCSGLKHTQTYISPFIERLEVHLSRNSDCVDIRNIMTFDERTFFEYDQVIFVFLPALDSIPSSTLEIFQKLEGQKKNNTEVYAMIACDEYETEKCDLSEKIIERWCEREHLHYKGSLKIGSVFFIMKTASRFIVSNHIKNFASAILNNEEFYSRVTVLTEKMFMKKANQYWEKEIKRKKKENKQD